MPPLARAVAYRMVRWNALVMAGVAATLGLLFGVVGAFTGQPLLLIGLPLVWGLWGLAAALPAGAAHTVALLPVVLWSPRRPLPYVRAVATLTSVALVAAAWRRGLVTVAYVPYVLLTPFLAARGYDAARAAAALSAARRNGARSGSRTSGAASDSRRATSA